MKSILENLGMSVALLVVMIYGILFGIIVPENAPESAIGFWLLYLLFTGLMIGGAIFFTTQPPDKQHYSEYVLLFGASSALFFGLLAGSAYWMGIQTPVRIVFEAVTLGIPLGIGASACVKSAFRATAMRDIAVGAVTGAAGFYLAMALFLYLFQRNGVTFFFIPFEAVVDFDPLHLIPERTGPDATQALMCQAGFWDCSPANVIVTLFRAVLASLGSMWNALWIGLVIYAVTAGVRGVLGMHNR